MPTIQCLLTLQYFAALKNEKVDINIPSADWEVETHAKQLSTYAFAAANDMLNRFVFNALSDQNNFSNNNSVRLHFSCIEWLTQGWNWNW